MDFDEVYVISLFKRKNYRVHMYLGIISNIFPLAVSVFYTATGPNMVFAFLLPLKLQEDVRPLHKVSLKLVSASPVHQINYLV